jgi:hypothetical protein
MFSTSSGEKRNNGDKCNLLCAKRMLTLNTKSLLSTTNVASLFVKFLIIEVVWIFR